MVTQFDGCTHNTICIDFGHCFMQTKVQSMGVDEPFGTSTLLKQLFSSMAICPQCKQCQPHQPDLNCNLHHLTHHHPIVGMSSQQTCISNHHGEFHNMCHKFNDIFHCKVNTHQYNKNLMDAKVAS
jgi:hypothetical protein